MPNIPLYEQEAQTGIRHGRVIYLKGDISNNLQIILEILPPSFQLQTTVDCHHINNFNPTVKMTQQIFLELPENGEGKECQQDLRDLPKTINLNLTVGESLTT